MRGLIIVLLLIMLIAVSVTEINFDKTRPVEKNSDSVIIALAGQFRVVFANLLWIKLDQYHHEYIAHGGDWAKDTNAAALSRIITKLDPHFTEAYAAGARILLTLGKKEEARAYLQEGIDNNPDSLMLHDEMGTMLARHFGDYKNALYHFRRAYILAGDDEWQHRRLGRLIHTVESMSKPSQSSISRS